MASFFSIKKLRRRSKASLITEKVAAAATTTDTSSDDSRSHSRSHGTTPTTGSLTPPSIAQQSDPALPLQAPKPPMTPSATSPQISSSYGSNNGSIRGATPTAAKRLSVSGMAGLGSPMANGSNRVLSLPVSPYSPRILNIQDNTWVYQKVLLVHGTIGMLNDGLGVNELLDGTVTVSRLDDGFPPVQWPVHDSHFKALVYLLPGANRIRFDFGSPKLANSGSSNPIHASYMTLHMMPPMGAPPVHLAILLGSDSPGTFDAVPTRAEREGNGLEMAVRKFRMAAYMWQAFTAEQMWRNRLGRRVFRFEEEWTQSTANYRDESTGTMRSEARVHIIRADKTRAELRSLDLAPQNSAPKDRNDLLDIAVEALHKHFQPKPGQTLYVSVLLLDAHWDVGAKTVTGHAAMGGATGDMRVAVFGSHCLQSIPSAFEDVVPALTDCTPTDPAYLANENGEAGSSWEACNMGIGGHLHEMGRLLGLPDRESGVMLHDYVRLHRSFLTRESYSTRTRSKRSNVLQEGDECTWHRLDCLHFRSHPCFRLPNDPAASSDDSVHAWPVGSGNVLLTAASGMSYLEIFGEGDDVCHSWIEFPGLEGSSGSLRRQVTISEQEVRGKLGDKKRKDGPLRVIAHTWGGGSLEIEDLRQLSREATTRLSGGLLMGLTAFRSCRLGRSQTEGSQPHEVIFASAERQERVMTRVIFYGGESLQGMEFAYDDDSRQLFGKHDAEQPGDVFDMDVRRGEYISGFYVRSGAEIESIQILTSLGRRSPTYGKAQGGSGNMLVPPRGYTICGVTGSCGSCIDGFSVLITKWQ